MEQDKDDGREGATTRRHSAVLALAKETRSSLSRAVMALVPVSGWGWWGGGGGWRGGRGRVVVVVVVVVVRNPADCDNDEDVDDAADDIDGARSCQGDDEQFEPCSDGPCPSEWGWKEGGGKGRVVVMVRTMLNADRRRRRR